MSLGTPSASNTAGAVYGSNELTMSHRTPPFTVASSTPKNPSSAYLMPVSPSKTNHGSEGYRPNVKNATGQVPACLVNASVTYCGNNQIYAFGGFDQYTDEGSCP